MRAAVLTVLLPILAVAAEPSSGAGPDALAPGTVQAPADRQRIRRVGPHLYRIGAVTLDAGKRTVRLSGRVNMDRGGAIELLACLPRGKVHESVLTLDVKPKDLQVALLLLGLKAGRNPAVRYPEPGPEAKRPAGSQVLLFVQWRARPADGGEPQEVRVRAERLLYNVDRKRPAKEARWVFLGSRIADGRFGADLEGSLITTYHDPLAILELVLPTVNDDVYYIVNEELSPPVGTPVELVIELPPGDADSANDAASEKGE